MLDYCKLGLPVVYNPDPNVKSGLVYRIVNFQGSDKQKELIDSGKTLIDLDKIILSSDAKIDVMHLGGYTKESVSIKDLDELGNTCSVSLDFYSAEAYALTDGIKLYQGFFSKKFLNSDHKRNFHSF